MDLNFKAEAYKSIDTLVKVIELYFDGTIPRFIHTDEHQPADGQACWVRHRNGAEYRMTYPFNHKDYPLWYPLPKD